MRYDSSDFTTVRNSLPKTHDIRDAHSFPSLRAPNGVYLTEKASLDVMRTDARALWLLADQSIPCDVKEMAERWKMSETLQEMWRNAFMEGWRAAHMVPDHD